MALRITFVVPHLQPSGGTRIILTYAEGLAERGHHVSIVSASSPGFIEKASKRVRRWAFGDSSTSDQRVKFIQLNCRGSDIVPYLPESDLLIATWWETVESVADAPASKGLKVHLVQDHEVFPYLPVARATSVHRLPFYKITVSDWLFDLMREEYQATRLRLVRNPVDLSEFRLRTRSMCSAPTVGTLYSTAPRKNSARAVEAVCIVRRSMPGLRFVGYGGTALPRSVAGNCFTTFEVKPDRKRIAEIYGSADFWLFTSESEGFGLPILESMAAGTPVIATRAGAAPELVSDRTGVLVDHDAIAVSNAILNLYARGSATWAEMSANCRSVAEANDLAPAISKFERVLIEIATNQPDEPERFLRGLVE